MAFKFWVTHTSKVIFLLGALSNYTCYPYAGFQGILLVPIKLWLKQLCYSPVKKKQQAQNGVMVHFVENFEVTAGFWKLCEFWSPRVSVLDLSLCGLWAVVASTCRLTDLVGGWGLSVWGSFASLILFPSQKIHENCCWLPAGIILS